MASSTDHGLHAPLAPHQLGRTDGVWTDLALWCLRIVGKAAFLTVLVGLAAFAFNLPAHS